MNTEPAQPPTPPEPAPQTPTQATENKADRGGHVDQPITIRGRMR